MNLDYTLNSDRNSHRIAAKIHKVVRSAQHSHGASKVFKKPFLKNAPKPADQLRVLSTGVYGSHYREH